MVVSFCTYVGNFFLGEPVEFQPSNGSEMSKGVACEQSYVPLESLKVINLLETIFPSALTWSFFFVFSLEPIIADRCSQRMKKQLYVTTYW